MHALNRHQRELSDLALTVTRQSQGVAVGIVDRLARSAEGTPHLLGRLWSLQLDVSATVADEPTDIVDGSYATLERFVALHRQFVQRLFEAIDVREHAGAARDLASVTPLIPRKHG